MTSMDVDRPDASAKRLEELGYEQQLERGLAPWQVVGIAMANASPTMAVVFFSTAVFAVGGTFGLGANFILGAVVLLIALCLAELGSMYPIAGGMYSLVRRVLPAPVTWITAFNYLLQGIVIPASIALGVAGFLQELLGIGGSTELLALATLVLAAGIALTRIEIGAWLILVMVVVNLVVLGIITVAALTQPEQPVLDVIFDPVVSGDGVLTGITAGVVLATLAPTFNVINGYDATLGFAEELRGGPRVLARTIVIAAALVAVFMLAPLTAAVVAAPDLNAFLSAENPVVYSVEQSLGWGASTVINIGAVVALFSAMLTLLMYFGRGFYATGRDGLWPPFVARPLGRVNRFRAPGAGVVAVAVPAGVLIFLSALEFLLIFSGTIICAVYFTIGIAAFWSRIKDPDAHRPYRMPLWPLAPVVVTGFTGLALVKQEGKYLLAELVLIGVALLFWLCSRAWGAPDLGGALATEDAAADPLSA